MIDIRPAAPEDAADIAALHVAIWREAYRGVMPEDYLATLDPFARVEEWRARLQDAAEPTRTVVAVREGVLVGFCTVGPCGLGSPEGFGQVHALSILVSAQHQGVGRRLMGEAARVLQGLGYSGLALSVLRDSPAARMFYDALGGRVAAHHQDEYPGFSLPAVEYRWPDLTTLIA